MRPASHHVRAGGANVPRDGGGRGGSGEILIVLILSYCLPCPLSGFTVGCSSSSSRALFFGSRITGMRGPKTMGKFSRILVTG